MSSHRNTAFSFLWRPGDLSPEALCTHRNTGTSVILDFSRETVGEALRFLESEPFAGFSTDARIPISWLFGTQVEDLVRQRAIGGLWVEYHPLISKYAPEAFFERLTEMSTVCPCRPVLGDVRCILDILRSNSAHGIPAIALKGSEGSGFVSTESAFILFGAARDLQRDRHESTRLHIWGGVATPEAASALLACGAESVIFESIHWLTNLHPLNDSARRTLERIQIDHTDVAGLDLGIPYRAHNRGNSASLRGLQEIAAGARPRGNEATEHELFVEKVDTTAVHPLDAAFGREELVPLSVEAVFAREFVERFGFGTEDAIRGFVEKTAELYRLARENPRPFAASPMARELGTRYPFIQGGMSSISDMPDFALAVAEAGGLPTIALGFMDRESIDRKLGDLQRVMAHRPYAVNLVALQENPYRAEQLEWIRETRPPFVVIAAGEPSFAAELADKGIESIYIAPSEELLGMALEAGIRIVVLEGCESGGHVGFHTTLTLAQMAIAMRRREPSLWEGRRLILAGGMCNAETVFMASMLGADAVQMGTVYLATREITDTGALTRVYQRAVTGASPGGTVITGESSGLRVRSLRTPRTEAIRDLERELQGQGTNLYEHRRRMEELCAGSLYIAARGEEKATCRLLDEETCWETGQFMSGACAGSIHTVRSVSELHEALAAGVSVAERPDLSMEEDATIPALRSVPRKPLSWQGFGERIAITGMSVVNSLGHSPGEILQASLAGKSGVVAVPPARWNHDAYYHPVPMTPEKTYCRVGAFHHLEITRKQLGIPPQDFRTMTHSTRLTLWLAAPAIEESGLMDGCIAPERIGVIISQNSGEAASTFSDIVIGSSVEPTLATVRGVVPMSPEKERELAWKLKNGHITVDDTTLVGRLNCTAGGYIGNRYGFMGPSYAVTAACSSSLVALYNAILLIRLGIIDAAVVGGGEEPLHPLHFLEFSALGALAGLSGADLLPEQTSRPFDAARDGMVLGEGGAIVVVERESSARRRGAPIHGFITGVGASNNPHGLVESHRDSQGIAIRASFAGLPYGPEAVDLIECHATSTAQGDVEEVQAIRGVFPRDARTVLTSFKSQIGHTLGASGLNSLIRGLMALKAGVFPQTVNYDTPDPALGIEEGGLRVTRKPEDWKRSNGGPRRMQVNSFGFGGSNYVVQIEECLDGEGQMPLRARPASSRATAAGPATSGELEGLAFFELKHNGETYRASMPNDSPGELEELLRQVRRTLQGGEVGEKVLRSLGRKGIFCAPKDGESRPLALVFPGQGSQYRGMGRELYTRFPVVREWLDRAAAMAEFDLLSLYLEDREEELRQTLWQQPSIYALEYALYRQLLTMGIRPAAVAGHSLGELTALAAAGVFSFEDGFRLVTRRAQSMDKASSMRTDPGVMMATDAPLELLREEIPMVRDVYIANINAPRQVVLGGGSQAVQEFGSRLKASGYRATLLRVSMAFHCPLLPIFRDEMRAFTKALDFHSPRIPVASNTTARLFPENPEEIKEIVVSQPESPVHWMDNVLTLWNDLRIRRFVEMGPGVTLSDLIRDTVQDPDCMATCMPGAEVTSFRKAIAELFVKGHIAPAAPIRVLAVTDEPGDKLKPPATPAVPMRESEASRPRPSPGDPLSALIHREISGFVVDTFGRFLNPMLLSAVRRELDPGFTEDQLRDVLQTMFQRTPLPGPMVPETAPLPVARSDARIPETRGPAPPVAVAVTAACTPTPEAGKPRDLAEEVIDIIMEVTGYERDEVEPQMDLRLDLGIRSSRLPIIVDQLEKRFDLKIRMEDFLDVRTVGDMTLRIGQLTQGTLPYPAPGEQVAGASRAQSQDDEKDGEKERLKRLVFRRIPVETMDGAPVPLTRGTSVCLLAPSAESPLCREVAEILGGTVGARVEVHGFIPGNAEDAFNAGTDVEIFLILLDASADTAIRDIPDACETLEHLFLLLKRILAEPSRRAAVLLHDDTDAPTLRRVLADGILGMFLCASLEYPSLQFRTATLKAGHGDLQDVLRQVLDKRQPLLDLSFAKDGISTLGGRLAPLEVSGAPGLDLNPGDVVVISGGGYGITAHLARALAPFTPRIVLLGRTSIDLPGKLAELLLNPAASEKALRWEIMQQDPDIGFNELGAQIQGLCKARQVLSTMEDLRREGLDVEYLACDVTDPEQVRGAMDRVLARYGRVDGIIHGAGILEDAFLADMDLEAFRTVVRVKLLGAWNLFNACSTAGLKFLFALSSIVGIQGNMGQANYGAGNRMMSRLLQHLADENKNVLFKALMLPPVSGGGMADNLEVREILERFGVGYIGAEELTEMFRRELIFGRPEDPWVMWMKSLPAVKTTLLEGINLAPSQGGNLSNVMAFSPGDYPLVGSLERLDLHQGVLAARRGFSLEKDPWIAGHKPFKFLKHPLVSAIMALEALLEATRLLFPYLRPIRVQAIRFLDTIEVGPEGERDTVITCRRVAREGRDVRCECVMEAHGVSPSGRRLDRLETCYSAEILMAAKTEKAPLHPDGFPISTEAFTGPPMTRSEILNWYENRSDMQALYRILHAIDGYGPGIISGRMIAPDAPHFSFSQATAFQYPPYALEGLMQLCSYYIIMRDETEERAMIPAGIGSVRWFGTHSGGSPISLQACLKREDDQGLVWDGMAVGENGDPLLELTDLHMRWFKE